VELHCATPRWGTYVRTVTDDLSDPLDVIHSRPFCVVGSVGARSGNNASDPPAVCPAKVSPPWNCSIQPSYHTFGKPSRSSSCSCQRHRTSNPPHNESNCSQLETLHCEFITSVRRPSHRVTSFLTTCASIRIFFITLHFEYTFFLHPLTRSEHHT
jgi:hypothetical protein